MGTTVTVSALPDCAFCPIGDKRPAEYDFKTLDGRWGYGCREHYILRRLFDKLGTGKGQRLVLAEDANPLHTRTFDVTVRLEVPDGARAGDHARRVIRDAIRAAGGAAVFHGIGPAAPVDQEGQT